MIVTVNVIESESEWTEIEETVIGDGVGTGALCQDSALLATESAHQ